MTSVLLVIDMQEGSFSPRSARHDARGVIHRINALAAKIRANRGEVIFIQHCGREGDAHHPDASGHALLPELHVEQSDRVLLKTNCDSFLGTELDAVLAALRPAPLIIAGCATDYCVDTTVRSALARGLPTIVAADYHTTADRAHLPATKIIVHHNAIWADFVAPAGPARVLPADSIP